uniref:Uncharacterized protein n=1 Tax=Romanomermis culicivorax TaxID=13658 RepID=A0A915KNS3_ROMCU
MIEKKRIMNPVLLDPSSPDMAIIDMDRMRDDSREPLALNLNEGHENLTSQLNTSFCPVPLDNENNDHAAAVSDDIKLICISADDTGRHLARLHSTDTVWFRAQICLNLKLLILSTFIRLTGGTETTVDIVNLIKYLFTCCANNE